MDGYHAADAKGPMAHANTDQPDDSDLIEFYQADAPGAMELPDSPTDIGTRIAEARAAAGLSRRDLSEHLGVRLATVSRWETGRSTPRPNRMNTISGLLGVSLSWLLMGRGETAPDGTDIESIGRDLLALKETLRIAMNELDRIALQLDSLRS